MITANMDPTVSAFNAYADVAFADSYIEILGATNQSIWNNTPVSAQNAALVYATQNIDYLFLFPTEYCRTDPEQLLEFPKKYVPIAGIRALRAVTDRLPRRNQLGLPSNKFDTPFWEHSDLDYASLFFSLSDRSIATFPDDEIPVFLSQATVDFAILFLDNADLSTLQDDEIKRVKLDVLEVEYFANLAKTRGAPTISKLAKWGILYNHSLLEPSGGGFSRGGRVGF